MLVPYPENAGPESWSAETRGNVVVLLLGRKASGKRVLSRLGIVLSHELFHLWAPNSLQLTGAYDWFFEGFTLYQALLMDQRLHFISFDDYLRTLASVYDSYLSAADHERLSLLAASERRWTTASSLVYDQGMLVAFLYDLSLRSRTDCQSSLENLYLKLFKAKPTGQENANETIIKLLTEGEGFADFAHTYVENAGEIHLDKAISEYGLTVQRSSAGTRLVVGQGLTDKQRQALRCLGYRR
jgi:predicted metalloprotease with PDZ domain